MKTERRFTVYGPTGYVGNDRQINNEKGGTTMGQGYVEYAVYPPEVLEAEYQEELETLRRQAQEREQQGHGHVEEAVYPLGVE